MMDGRVSFGDQVVALPALRQGKAQKKGELWHLLLTDKSRGKVVIGDVTVLFQFVTPPPVQPRPQLPPSVRASLMQNLDWMLVAVVAASFLMHFGFVIYLRNIDWPRKPDIEEIPDRFVQMIVPKKIEEPKPEVAEADEKQGRREERQGREEGEGRLQAQGEEGAAQSRGRGASAAERRARLAADVQKMGVLKLLGAKGEDGTRRRPRQGRRRLRRRRQGVRPGRRRRRRRRGRGRAALGQGRRRHRLVARRRLVARVGPGRGRHRRARRRARGQGYRQGLGAYRRRRLARPERHRQGDRRPSGRGQGLLRAGSSATRASAASCSCASKCRRSAR